MAESFIQRDLARDSPESMQLPFPAPVPPSQEWVRGRETKQEDQQQAGNRLKARHLSPGPKTVSSEYFLLIHIPCISVSGICATYLSTSASSK